MVTIYGNVQYQKTGYIYLHIKEEDGFVQEDSAQVDEQKEFQLQLPKGEDRICRIDFFGKQQREFVASKDDIRIFADGSIDGGFFVVEGNQELDLTSKFYALKSKYETDLLLVNQKIKNAQFRDDQEMVIQQHQYIKNLGSNYQRNTEEIIRSLNGSLTALILLINNFDVEQNLDFYAEQIELFENSLADNWLFHGLKSQYQEIARLAVGSYAPNFSLPDPEGKNISLASLKGKIVLIDFWGSWCQPCRLQNPTYVQVYDKYRDAGFEIIGVAFERKKENWLKAIEKDGLEWVHVSDLKYFDSDIIPIYNISNVPSTFLLDKEGKILAKNIHANELEEWLRSLL